MTGRRGAPDERADREENVKHLEMIQSIITRLGGNSFLIKGWCLTVAAATYGFAVNRVDWRITLIGLAVVATFWSLDAYFLRQERLFRHLYNHVRRSWVAVPRFSMNLQPFLGFHTVQRWKVFFSVTLVLFYGSLVVVGIVVSILAHQFRP